jgi:hypothetical protein
MFDSNQLSFKCDFGNDIKDFWWIQWFIKTLLGHQADSLVYGGFKGLRMIKLLQNDFSFDLKKMLPEMVDSFCRLQEQLYPAIWLINSGWKVTNNTRRPHLHVKKKLEGHGVSYSNVYFNLRTKGYWEVEFVNEAYFLHYIPFPEIL